MQISTVLRGDDLSYAAKFHSLQYALYIPTFILVFAGVFFLISSYYVDNDRTRAEEETQSCKYNNLQHIRLC